MSPSDQSSLPSQTAVQAKTAPSLQRVRKETKSSIVGAIESKEDTLIHTPPASGKTYGSFEAIEETNQPAIYLSPRRDLYTQAQSWCEERELSAQILPSMPHDCSSYESNLQVQSLYHRGMTPSEIHNKRNLCERSCPYLEKQPETKSDEQSGYSLVPQEEVDVLIGSPKHAYVPAYVAGRVVIFDDISKTQFIEEFHEIEAATNELLQDSSFPCDNLRGLYQAREYPHRQKEALKQLDILDLDIWKDEYTHKNAEKIVRTILDGEQLDNGYTFFGSSENAYYGITDGSHSVYLLEQPRHLGLARNVLALDAYPMFFEEADIPLWWNRRLGVPLRTRSLLSTSQLQKYVSESLGISVIQTTHNAKPYSSGEHITEDNDGKLLRYVSSQNDDESVSVITTKKARSRLKEKIEEETEGLVDDWLHFAQVRSNNEFEDRDLGVVLGSPHYGDDHLKRLGAFLNQSIEGKGKGMERTYGKPVGNELLRGMREASVAQAILRFGRSEEVASATVYVHTAAIPGYIPVERSLPEEFGSWIDTELQIMRYLYSDDSFFPSTTEIANNTVVTRRSVSNNLQKMNRTELVDRIEFAAANKPDWWIQRSSDELPEKYQHVVRKPI